MGLWNTINRNGKNVTGSVSTEAELVFLEQKLTSLRVLLHTGTKDPIGRFSRALPEEMAEIRGVDIFLTENSSIFFIQGRDTISAVDFYRLVKNGSILLNADMSVCYGPIMESFLNDTDNGLVPKSALVYDEAIQYGMNFEDSNELKWLESMLIIHSGILKTIKELQEKRETLLINNTQRTVKSVNKINFPPLKHILTTIANSILPGIGFFFTRDPINGIVWLIAVFALVYFLLYIFGGIIFIILLWIICVLFTGRHTYKHIMRGYKTQERAMTIVPISVASIILTDVFLLKNSIQAEVKEVLINTSIFSDAVLRFIIGPISILDFGLLILLIVILSISLFLWVIIKHTKRTKYGAPESN